MRKEIRDILNSNRTKEEKYLAMNQLFEEVRTGQRILSGEIKYCAECDDYYLAKSFLTETETRESKVCIYEDWMNSGGNEYADGFIDTVYEVCPKGHKRKIRENEREK